MTRLGSDTWVWVPSNGRTIRMQRDDEPRPRDVRIPSWYKNIFWVAGSRDGRSVVFVGWQAPSEDSLGIGVLTLPDNKFTQVFATFGEGGGAWMLDDGSIGVILNDTPESATLYRVPPGGSPKRLGSTPRLISQGTTLSVSTDLRRAFLITPDDRRDIWMSRVVR